MKLELNIDDAQKIIHGLNKAMIYSNPESLEYINLKKIRNEIKKQLKKQLYESRKCIN